MKMKAIVCSKYGPPDVLQLKEVEKPSPKDNEILIKTYATTVTAGDSEIRGSKLPFVLKIFIRLFMGIRKPRKTLGQELAGEIEAVGKNVRQFEIGDQILAHTGFSFGGYAEYDCLPEKGMIVKKPANISYGEAAAIPTGGLAALLLRKAKIRSGQKVLIYGASGSIGTFALQLAKYYGAEVTAVGSPISLELLLSLGADKVIDYTTDDFTQNGETYDVIFDTLGKSSPSRSIKSLKEKGLFLSANPGFSLMFRGLWTAMTSSKKVLLEGGGDDKVEDLVFLKDLVKNGKIKMVIDKNYSLDQIVEAHQYVDEGQKIGNVVINVVEDQNLTKSEINT
jgi:NADPH:quinone reductase-like Zn-dependent oxidoreductase